MGAIVLIDTSVYVNILDVPNNNQNREGILAEFEDKARNGDYFLLPMVTILETGNHISKLRNGDLRYRYAQILVSEVSKALEGASPFRPTYFPSKEVFFIWLKEFPNYAKRTKSPAKPAEGISLSDLSIIKEFQETCRKNNMSEVIIWSLDSDLTGYCQLAR